MRPLSSLRSIVQLGVAPLQAIRVAVQPALSANSSAKPYADFKAQPIQGACHQPSIGHPLTKDSITKRGTVIFRVGNTAVRDNGKCFQVSRGATDDGLCAVLAAAAQRFGSVLKVDGSDAFKQNLIRVAAQHAMPLSFADPTMERERQRLTLRRRDTHVERTEQQQTDRWNTGMAGSRAVTPESAVAKYIAGRAALRSRGLDIPIHKRYSSSDAGTCRYAGVRQVDGQHMVLLERENAVLVLPIADGQLPRMKRRRIGESVAVSKDGAIKSKGRSNGTGAGRGTST